LMSDGSENSFYNKRNKVLSPSLARLFKLASVCDGVFLSQGLGETLENCVKQKTFDDCSIVLMSQLAKGRGFMDLADADKCELLRLPDTRASRKRLKSFEDALDALHSWGSCRATKRRLHWRGKKLDRVLARLAMASLLQVREDGCYKSTLKRMEKSG